QWDDSEPAGCNISPIKAMKASAPSPSAPDGTMLAAAGFQDGRISLWEAGSGRLIRMLGRQRAGEITCLASSADGRSLASGDRGGEVWFWDPGTGKSVAQINADRVSVDSIAFSPRGDIWAAAGYSEGITLRETHRPRALLELQSVTSGGDVERDHYEALAFSPDGSRLAAASAYQFRGEEFHIDKLPSPCDVDPMEMKNHPEYFMSKMNAQMKEVMEAIKDQCGGFRWAA